jgi:5-(aminomethyl)-3-furanmethanol phosphate kinase
MSHRNARVIKLGGSLLDASGWPDAFRRWLARQPPMPNVLIVGGGALAEAIRRWDRIHRLAPTDAHWLAIGTMALTARLAGKLLPEAAWTDEWSTVLDFAGNVDPSGTVPFFAGTGRRQVGGEKGDCPPLRGRLSDMLLIFDPSRFLETIEPTLGGDLLPVSWDVTSDSIAARIGGLLGCRELVLLKSCLPGQDVTSLDRAADSQYVDRAFPRFARDLVEVRFVNLDDREFAQTAIVGPKALATSG